MVTVVVVGVEVEEEDARAWCREGNVTTEKILIQPSMPDVHNATRLPPPSSSPPPAAAAVVVVVLR
jgi:hypothetical protein